MQRYTKKYTLHRNGNSANCFAYAFNGIIFFQDLSTLVSNGIVVSAKHVSSPPVVLQARLTV